MKVHVYSIPWHCSTWTFNFPSHCSVCISTLLPFFRAQKSSTTSKMPRGRPRSHCHSWCGTVDGNKSEPVKSRLFDKLQGFIHPEWIGRISSVIFVVFFFSLGDYQAWPKWLIQRHKRQNIHDAEALAIKGSALMSDKCNGAWCFFLVIRSATDGNLFKRRDHPQSQKRWWPFSTW